MDDMGSKTGDSPINWLNKLTNHVNISYLAGIYV